jgi:hypothetical protein
MQHYESEAGYVEKSSFWIYPSAGWSTTHPGGARIWTSPDHIQYKVSQRKIQLG